MKTIFSLGWLALTVASPWQASSAADDVVQESAQEVMGEDEARVYTFKRGVNISHWLSQNSEARPFAAPWFGEDDVAWIAEQGFDHIRLPVDMRLCVKEDGSLDPEKMRPVEELIFWAGSRGLGIVLDAHFLPGADFNAGGRDRRVFTDEALQTQVAALWEQVGRHFADEGPWLRFEILNEPVADENRHVNTFMSRMLTAIRESNTMRVVYVTSNRWSSFETVDDVQLPDDPYVALTLHTYEPMVFTHQRAPWVGFKDSMPAVTFPGTVPDLSGHTQPGSTLGAKAGEELTVAKIEEAFAKVETWVKQHAPKTEIYIGEFGAYRAADPESQRKWIRTVVEQCEKRGWGWAVWDYQGGFAVRKPDGSGTPILEGLFQKAKTESAP